MSSFKNFDWFYFVGKADCNHNLIVMFESIDNDNVKKVGQSPSPEALNENFSKPTIDRYLLDIYEQLSYYWE